MFGIYLLNDPCVLAVNHNAHQVGELYSGKCLKLT